MAVHQPGLACVPRSQSRRTETRGCEAAAAVPPLPMTSRACPAVLGSCGASSGDGLSADGGGRASCSCRAPSGEAAGRENTHVMFNKFIIM